MDERHLLLLGVLMAQSQHAYRINDFIETNLGRVSNMKRATAYALLERLEKRGLVRMEVQTVGNHPPRKVYSITEAGKQAFLDLLQALLARVEEASSAADIALMFIDYLPGQRAEELLRRRLDDIRKQIRRLTATPGHAFAPGVDYAVQRKIAILQAERDWLEQVLGSLTGPAAGPAASGPSREADRCGGGTSGQADRPGSGPSGQADRPAGEPSGHGGHRAR